LSTPWIVAFCVVATSVILLFVVVTGIVRRAIAVLEDRGSGDDVLTNSLRVTSLYGGIPPGTVVPDFLAKDASGRPVPADELFAGPRLCVFVSPGCAPCDMLLGDLAASEQALDLPLLVIAHDANNPKYASLPPQVTVVEQVDDSASTAFQSKAFPQGFAVDADRVVRAVTLPNVLADLWKLASALEGGDRATTVSEVAAA
jgi:hypothetical protein